MDVSKSTAYADLSHVTPYALDLMSDAHALSRRSNETEITGQPILSCALPLALDLMAGAHAVELHMPVTAFP